MANDTDTQNVRNGNIETDAQICLTGTLKKNSRTEMVVFNFSILLMEVTAIVVIPEEGTIQAPVYLKCKIRQPK